MIASQALRVGGARLCPAWVLSACLVPAWLVQAGCTVTGDGSTGDPPSEPDADQLGNGFRIHEVVGPATWFNPADLMSANCAVPSDRQLRATGQSIVAVDRFDETNDGQLGNIYIQDYTPPGEVPLPFSGLTVFAPGFTPPDLRVYEGDVVDTFGTFTEFLGPGSTNAFGECKTLPEISGALSLRFEAAQLEPIVLVPPGSGGARWEPLKGYVNARQWIGMLVQVQGVVIATDGVEDANGRYSADFDMGGGLLGSDVVSISNELYDIMEDGPTLTTGTPVTSVTGILTYFYGFRIAPRSADDVRL